MRRPYHVAIAALVVGGCGQHVSGVVQEAASGRPVANAVVELSNTGWGLRNGQLVWDAEKVSSTTTDERGRFAFDADGGINLRVRATHHAPVATSLCARSPMIVRIGGPYAGLRTDRRLLPDSDGALGLTVSPGPGDNEYRLRVEAKGGVRFVEGTGAIPPPPPLPYAGAVELDLRSDCGWLFVSDGASPIAVIQAGALGWEQDPGGARRWVMLYTPLPRS